MVVKIIKNKDGSITRLENVTPSMTITPVRKVVKKPLSTRQEGVVAMVAKGGKSKAEILRANNYSEAVARNPSKVFNSPVVAEAIAPIVEQISSNRDKIVKALAGKSFEKESAFNLSMMMNMHNKDVQLLSGLPTSREEYVLPAEEQEKLDKLLEMNKNPQ